nr:MAG TPA: hypothetical protein [Caudoviricetes sp.]
MALAQSTAPAAVQLWHGAPVAFSARYQLTLFFISYQVFAPEIFYKVPRSSLPRIADRSAKS